MSQRITKGSHEWEDVCHYTIEKFMEHPRAEELIDKGEAMKFMSGMMYRSFHSSTSPYHTLYRQKGRMHSLKPTTEPEAIEYNYEIDITVEAISAILEEMQGEHQQLWYQSKLFQMWMDEPNYSELSRKTGIPRTSISQAVQDCKDYIRLKLKERNIDYDL